ncbi:hypothetical protein [Rubritalea halochordaticola]
MGSIGSKECQRARPDSFFGFVYLITNTRTGRQYLGRLKC